MKQTLDENLFKQHLVNNIVPKIIVNHILSEDPKNALVISIHGCTGSKILSWQTLLQRYYI